MSKIKQGTDCNLYTVHKHIRVSLHRIEHLQTALRLKPIVQARNERKSTGIVVIRVLNVPPVNRAGDEGKGRKLDYSKGKSKCRLSTRYLASVPVGATGRRGWKEGCNELLTAINETESSRSNYTCPLPMVQ